MKLSTSFLVIPNPPPHPTNKLQDLNGLPDPVRKFRSLYQFLFILKYEVDLYFLPGQWSPTSLAPGTGFVEANFSMDRGGGMVQAVM